MLLENSMLFHFGCLGRLCKLIFVLQLRKWNERWVILDPTTGRMEYKYVYRWIVSLL